jgi:hypothetical protein
MYSEWVMAVSRKQLDAQGCGAPLCGHDHTVLFVHPVCHIGAGLEVSYDKRDGVLTIRCHRCKQLVTEILVATD